MSEQLKSSEHLRLFIAIPVPDTIKDRLCALQDDLKRLLPKTATRWTVREQIHLTLRFFGNVRTDDLERVQSALQNACKDAASFRVQVSSLGVFPEKRFPRVVWTGVRDDQNQLGALQRNIETATAQFGEKPDDRPFSAHLTLGRIKDIRPRDAAMLREFVSAQARRLFGEWDVGELELIRSELGSDGAKHSVVATYQLPRLGCDNSL